MLLVTEKPTRKLPSDMFNPLFDVLSDGLYSTKEIADILKVDASALPKLERNLSILVDINYVSPCFGGENEGERIARTRAFNDYVLGLAGTGSFRRYLASPVTCSGVPVDMVSQLFLLGERRHKADLVNYAWSLLQSMNAKVQKDGVELEPDEGNIDELRSRYKTYREKEIPVYEKLGIV
jgi:hypothetical protein